jgi:hypothetical protein
MMRIKTPFTLLEILIGMALLLMASGVMGWNLFHAIKKKRFQSEVERFQARFKTCQKLAMAMQADWIGELKKKGASWTFEVACVQREGQKISPLTAHCRVFFEGREKSSLIFQFFSTGQVLPQGTFLFVQDEEKMAWKIEEALQREEGTKGGPTQPKK